MELNDYQEKAFQTCNQASNNLPYMLFNLIGEVGEILEKITIADYNLKPKIDGFIQNCDYFGKLAKAIRKKEIKEPLYFLPEDQILLKKELGDVLWQLSGLSKVIGCNLDEIALMNLDKLADRAKRDVIVGEGDER